MLKLLWGIVPVILFAAAAFAQPCLDAAKEVAPVLSEQARKTYEQKLSEAHEQHRLANNADSYIWVGRRIAYLGSYKEAIAWFTMGIEKSEQANPRLYRHRGHRYLTLRCFDDAIKDFETAAKLIKGKPDEIEPDGLPNAKNIPTSTLQSNIWYHLGLAYYLKGDLLNAIKVYEEAEKVSNNNDMKVATAYWYYMTLRRAGWKDEAKKLIRAFDTNIEVIENDDYLKLLKLNKGELRAEALLKTIQGDANSLGSASLGYGIGNYFLYNGDKTKATTIFRKITAGDQWASFGYIGAETDLTRLAAKN